MFVAESKVWFLASLFTLKVLGHPERAHSMGILSADPGKGDNIG